MRRTFRSKRDRELQQIHLDGELLQSRVERDYQSEGGIETGIARLLCDKIEQMLVARAIGRQRRLTGGDGSHQDLGASFEPNPKKEDGFIGNILRRNRGVER